MKLFIANTTKQNFKFEYRRPESSRMYYRDIPAGTQLMVLDTTRDEIDMIIDHFGRYGMIDASRVDQAQAHIGLCYSVDKPVRQSIMIKALKDNENHLDRAGHDRRKVQLAASELSLKKQHELQGTGYRGDLEFEITEQRGPELNKELLAETLATGSEKPTRKAGRPRK